MIENPNHTAPEQGPKPSTATKLKQKGIPTSRARKLAAQATLKKKRAPHRPSIISPAIVNQIVTLLQNGLAVEVTAAAVGIHVTTFYNWMKRGEASSEGIYKDFFDGVSKAYAICEINMVKTVQKHADTDPTTARWLLSTRFPDRWSQVAKSAVLTKSEVTVTDAPQSSQAPVIVVNMPSLINTPRPMLENRQNAPKVLEINPTSGTIVPPSA